VSDAAPRGVTFFCFRLDFSDGYSWDCIVCVFPFIVVRRSVAPESRMRISAFLCPLNELALAQYDEGNLQRQKVKGLFVPRLSDGNVRLGAIGVGPVSGSAFGSGTRIERQTFTPPSSSNLECRGSGVPGATKAMSSAHFECSARRASTRLGPFAATNSPRHHALLRVSRSSCGDAEGFISRDQYLAMSISDNVLPEGIGNITPPQGVTHDGSARQSGAEPDVR